MKQLTKKQFQEFCTKYEPIVIGNETNNKHSWTIFAFKEVKGEYHQLDKH